MNPHSFDIMTLNLRFGLADDGPNNWALRSKAYPALLNAFPCDFYAFQEANDFQIAFLASILTDYQWIGQRCPAPERWQNNVIFYRRVWHCIAHDHFYLSNTPDRVSKFSDSRWPRQCTIGRFECGTHALLCTNTHLDFAPEVQRRSALLIKKRLQQHGVEESTLLMGDFNAGPSSSCYGMFTSEDAAGGAFKNAFDPIAQGGTHHGFRGVSNSRPIDWILYRGNLEARSARVITQQFSGYYPSDHFPLIATFDWPNEALD